MLWSLGRFFFSSLMTVACSKSMRVKSKLAELSKYKQLKMVNVAQLVSSSYSKHLDQCPQRPNTGKRRKILCMCECSDHTRCCYVCDEIDEITPCSSLIHTHSQISA